METYRIEHLNFTYPDSDKLALNDISLNIKQGEFVTLCGKSGCGKTTLLRHLKSVLTPHGERRGMIYFEGVPLGELGQREQSSKIGFVMQSPENQIVTDKVWHELAFGLESLGYDNTTIRLRVAEMASFFGIQTWFYKNVNELSGGQKQLLNLASIMALQPSVLILDEPTSQLDPIAAADFLATVWKINRELGVTVLIIEHRLEEVLPLSERVIVMDDGQVIADGTPREVGKTLKNKKHGMFLAMPTAMRIYANVDNNLECPITVREGRTWLDSFLCNRTLKELDFHKEEIRSNENLIEIKEVWFRYEKNAQDIVKGLNMSVKKGELYAIVGGNGTGKTTTLSLISKINRPYRGQIKIRGRRIDEIPSSQMFNGLLGVLPQNPQSIFVKKTVKLDLYEILKEKRLSKEEKHKKVEEVSEFCELKELLHMHPYDLSGGEQQRAALAKVLLLEPEILLLDEPTKGLDGNFKRKLARILKGLQASGTTIVMVSHDLEFCAQYADTCAMFFDGNIVSQGSPREFFCGNNFYTTSANRIARHVIPNVVTADEVVEACGGKVEEHAIESYEYKSKKKDIASEDKTTKQKIPRWRKVISCTLLLICAGIIWVLFRETKDTVGVEFGVGIINSISMWKYAIAIMLCSLGIGIVLGILLWGRDKNIPEETLQVSVEKRKLSRRTMVATMMILLLIPLTVYIGVFYLDNKKYYFISMLVILETMLPFAMIYEGRKPQARELIIIAVLCAIGVAGRAAFFMLPQFKPVVAIVIISGVAFGGETGFLVGAMTGFVSNFFFGQGPWTPWQMFSFGIIGFLAGVLFRKGVLRRGRVSLCIFGGLATFFVFGGIMNSAHIIIFQDNPKWSMLLAAYLAGIPFDLIHATATVFFIWVIGPAMLEKLDRIKVKYGLIE